MKKLVIFDFDGTLMDTNSIIVESLNEAVKAYLNRELTEEELMAILGRPIVEQMEMVSREHRDDMVAFYRNYYRSHQEGRVWPFEGVKDLLEALRSKGIRCAILTNKGRNGLAKALKAHELEDFFDHTISADDIVNTKPNPQGILEILAILGVSPDEALMVGDSAHDIEAGKNACVETVLVSWTIISKASLAHLKPDIIIDHPMDLLKSLM